MLQNAHLYEETAEPLKREQRLNEIPIKLAPRWIYQSCWTTFCARCELVNADGSLLGIDKSGKIATVSHAYNFLQATFEENLKKERVSPDVIDQGVPILLED